MAKPDWQPKQRDRGRSRDRGYREPVRDNVILHPASNPRPKGPRQDNAKVQVAKQGVNGALRAANLRLLLEHTPVREALALVAEVPLERLEAMSQGALCPDETAFHIERTLKLPGKWLDGLNKEVPARTLDLLKNPDQAALHDEDDLDEGSPDPLPVVNPTSAQPAAAAAAVPQPAPVPTQAQVADAAASKPVEPSPGATNQDAAQTDREAAAAATGRAKALAGPGRSPTAGKRPATASRRAATVTEAQLPLSEIALPSQSGSMQTSSMATPELRKQNLTVLLQGKGAKSALARVLHAKPPYVSAMLSGRKSLDKELCHGMARALGLPDDWFEAPRTAADIPATTLQRLVSLRDATADADPTPGSTGTAPVPPVSAPTAASNTAGAASSAAPAPSGPSTAPAGLAASAAASQATAVKPKGRRTRGASQRGDQQLLEPADLAAGLTIAPAAAADLPAPAEGEVQPAAPEPAPVRQTEATASPAPVLSAAPVQAPAMESPRQLPVQPVAFTPMVSQPLVIEGGLAPITEALIKMLVLKARQGALSEDKAFELLGAVRLL